MTEKYTNLKTGIFVFSGLLLLMVSILLFGAARNLFRNYNHYTVKFRSTQGLSHGSVVSLSGMEVGNIADITIDKDGFVSAQVKVDNKFSDLITAKSQATIRTQGALGDKYIFIIPGEAGGAVIANNGIIPSETEPDLIEMITQGKGPDFSAVLGTIHELNILLNSLNSNQRVGHLIDNLAETSQNMTKLFAEPSVKGSFEHFRNILAKVDRGDGTLGALVNDSTLYNRLINLIGDEPRNKYLKPLIREAIRQNEKVERQH